MCKILGNIFLQIPWLQPTDITKMAPLKCAEERTEIPCIRSRLMDTLIFPLSVVLISYGLYNHGITDHMIKIMGISIRWAHSRESSNSSLLSLFLVSLMLWIEHTTFKLSRNYSNLSQSCCWVGTTCLACYQNSEHLTVHQHFHNCNNPSPSPKLPDLHW
jgi:hypothetical protein